MAYYKVVLHGVYSGQSIVNVLWYRAVESPLGALLDPASGEDITFQVQQEVWPIMRGIFPDTYTLQDITAYPYTSTLIPAFALPYVRQVNEQATRPEANNGPAPCAILACGVENTPLVNLLYPKETSLLAPRRGYLAIGPLIDAAIDNTGHIVMTGDTHASLAALATKLAETLENLDPVAFFVPLRARLTKVAGVLTLQGFAPIATVTIRPRASFRRSRLPEN